MCASSVRMGRVGPGVACPCAPLSCAYMVAWSKGEGEGGGDGVSLVPLHTYRVACPRAPPFHANGKGGARGRVPSRTPFLRVHGGAAEGGRGGAGGDGEGAPLTSGNRKGRGMWRGVPSCTPLLREWNGRGWVSRRPFHVEVSSAKGEGEAGVTRTQDAGRWRALQWWSMHGKGASAYVPCFDKERRGGGGKEGKGKTLWQKQNVPAMSVYMALQNWLDRALCRMSCLLPPRRPSPPLPICERGQPTSPSPMSHAAPLTCRQEGVTRARRYIPLSPQSHPFLLGHVATHGKGDKGTPPLPFPLQPRRHGHKGHPVTTTPPLPPSTGPPCTRRKGAHKGTRPSAPPFPFARKRHAQGAHCPVRAGTQGHVTPRPILPIRAEGMHTRGTPPVAPPFHHAPPCTCGKGPCMGKRPPVPPFPFAWKGRARGAQGPPSPWLRRSIHADSGTQGQAALIPWRPIRARRGTRGHPPPYGSHSRAGAVSVRLRSPCPHPVFACHCTT
ncbi:hypothetical protein EDB83DRAFT_2324684 [Lactarius deliciosus]|nr:hypothetical protein EDB83DRAFT_2324684 [Lactarius deliciosus]